MQQQINYKQIIDLGFSRQDDNDIVFFNQNGYECFWCDMKLHKKVIAHWCPEKKTVELRRMGKNGDILSRLKVTSLNELKDWVAFFKD